ncbi:MULTISPECIES: hypothetical protein [Niastella]|uniref:PKD domain-containing protein n=1 Tax=Niastella soli TaxID=2821487 RepID=A0ABS3YYI6_9BACT|nr:hypothetical protein [Niastella soli]MBO9202984.1 hypothetical protein [Niastella soli]
MKRILIPILFVTGVIGYLSCQKDNSSNSAAVQADKTEGIKKGEPVLFSVTNTSNVAAKWSVSPAENVSLTSDGNSATVYFRRSGSYSVIASMGNDVQRIMVSVSDSSYCDSTRRDSVCGFPTDTIPTIPKDTTRPDTTCNTCGAHDSTFSLVNDHINISVVKIDTGNVSGLVIKATTQNTYRCTYNTLLTGLSTGSNYTFTYLGVFVPGGCNSGPVPAQSSRVLYPIQDGSHGFSVVVNNVTYTGSFTKTGNQYSFTWPDVSKVTISPLTL